MTNQKPLAISILTIIGIGIASTSCGIVSNLTKGHCMKTMDGYEVCIKADEVNCETLSNGTLCSAYGRLYSLTGSESKHWSTKEEEEPDGLNLVNCDRYDYDENTFTCQAAKAHGKYKRK